MPKNALAKSFLRTPIGGRRYSRGPTDTNPPTTPVLAQPVAGLNSISLNWTLGTDAETGISSTWVEYSRAGFSSWTRIIVAFPAKSYVLTGLAGATAYDIRLKNTDNASPQNQSAYCAIQTITTLGSNPALEPGTISFVASSAAYAENAPASIAVQRVGAGSSCPALEADWQVIGLTEGTPSPANGTLSWAAGESGIKTIQTTTGTVTADNNGTLRIAALRALSGNIQPTLGSPNSIPFIVENLRQAGIKWNPGDYMGTDNHTFPDDRKLLNQQNEQNIVLSSGPRVLGWKGFYYASNFQGATLGVWDFSKIIRDLNRLRTMNPSKRIMVTILPQIFNSGSDYTNLLPASVYNDSSFGASPVAGKYGWWSMNGKTACTVAWWRPAVMDWIIDLFEAMAVAVNSQTGLTLDAEPTLEQTAFGETSMGVDSGTDFDYDQVRIQYQRLIDAYNLAWDETAHMCNNNYCGTEARTQLLTDYCRTHRTIQGSPDTYVAGQQKTLSILTWGQKAVLGVAQSDPLFAGPDYRGVIGMASDTQGPELSNPARYNMFTPVTFRNQVNNVLRQSHQVWTYASGSNDPIPAYPQEGPNTGANPGNWGSVMQVINGSPLTHIAKPTNLVTVVPPPPVGQQTDVPSNPVSVALNATGSGTRYDVTNDTEMRAVPWGSLTPGSVVNIFWKSTPYLTKIALRAVGTAADPVIVNFVTDASGTRPQVNGAGARTAAGCNPSGGYAGANDIFSSTPAFGEQLGIIVIKRGPQDEYGHGPTYSDSYIPAYIQILNADIFGANNGSTYTTLAGGTGAYSSNAGIWIQNGMNVLVKNCLLHDCGFGFFEMAKDGLLSQTCQNNTVSCSRIYNNGVVGSYLEHGFYRQGANPITEGCYIGQERPGALGSSYKSRASGEIWRYNWIEASARAMDFVHSEEQDIDGVVTQSDYGITWCYGNVIVNDFNLPNGGAYGAIHYGGDNGGEEDATTASGPTFSPSPLVYRSHLYFFNNTYVIRATSAQSYRTALLALSLVGTTADVWNNLIVVNGTSLFQWLAFAGTINLRGNNVVYGTISGNSHELANPAKLQVNHLGTDITADPRLTNIATRDYTLLAGSSAIDLSSTPAGVPISMSLKTGVFPTTVSFQPRPGTNGLVTRTTQGTALDLGALERGVS